MRKHKIFLVLFLSVCFFTAKAQTTPSVGLNIGDIAPEITLMNPDGEEISLSDLRGQMVLIDFWASWCGPCRAENPNVVSAYNKYHKEKFKEGKGFSVFNVSLDTNADRWKKGIADDKLDWPYHVSDLKGWRSAAAERYQIRGIPDNVLINGDGVIVGRRLRGINLENALDSLLK